ncbi:protease modulator HflC [Candidatus Paracaedibacter symbiosus]|uniref:protease modulator HflC n=1 Tax=Candidatus Paracaedibacter symbiosus TaxID=244582 RepID=UPI0005097ACE|nr:protease modulator HflC [Candidatus Paracaedibacter symbiosus]
MKKYLGFSLVTLGIFGILLVSSIFTVDQRSQVVVLQFGELKRVVDTPGLKLKIPFIEDVTYYDKRVLDFDLPAIPITTGDQKRIVVDTYTRYRINNPVVFFRTIKPADEQGAAMRLEALISSTVRNVIGKIPLRSLLTEERAKTMERIHQEVKLLTEPLGMDVIDIRIIRTELPIENRKAVFSRMNSELERIAKENLAKGAERAQTIRSTAEKDRAIILAEAQKEAQKIKGEGEAKALEIVSSTLGKDPDFYTFYRSLEAYKKTLKSDSIMILSTESELFKYFSNPEKNVR